MEILIIGAEPPCVRCKATFKSAQEIAGQTGVEVQVRKIPASSEEAKKFGRIISGHDITELFKLKVNKEKIQKISGEIEALNSKTERNDHAVQSKLSDLDKEISMSKSKALEQGYMMTPVVIIDGKVKSIGYVPPKEEIRRWIEDGLRK